jgi:hypothetical protein
MKGVSLWMAAALAALAIVSTRYVSTQQPRSDRCQADSKPVDCYEAELRGLGKVRGQLQSAADNATAQVTRKDAVIAQLRTQLAAASITNPAFQFLVGTWCDEQIPGAPRFDQTVVQFKGRDVLLTNGPQGITAAHLLAAPAGEWETLSMFRPAAPNASLIKITTHGKKMDDRHLQYTVTQAATPPLPPGPFPPPPPYVGTLARCD